VKPKSKTWSIRRYLRVQYPGSDLSRDESRDRRADIVDRQEFIKTLAEACQKTAWQAHAYWLMRNHFHIVFERPEANLVNGMSSLLSTYTIRLNRRHKISGHVFSGRYKSPLVTTVATATS
jgi:putative transposase